MATLFHFIYILLLLLLVLLESSHIQVRWLDIFHKSIIPAYFVFQAFVLCASCWIVSIVLLFLQQYLTADNLIRCIIYSRQCYNFQKPYWIFYRLLSFSLLILMSYRILGIQTMFIIGILISCFVVWLVGSSFIHVISVYS